MIMGDGLRNDDWSHDPALQIYIKIVLIFVLVKGDVLTYSLLIVVWLMILVLTLFNIYFLFHWFDGQVSGA